MPRYSKFTAERVLLSETTETFEEWLKAEGYQSAPAASSCGAEASSLIDDFVLDTDMEIGPKRRKQLERHADKIGCVIEGEFGDMLIDDDDPVDDDEDS